VADTFELELAFDNPYKRTNVYIKLGRAFFGRWQPIEVQLDGDEESVTIQEGQEGQLDLFAAELLGRRSLWRIIAQVNKINNVAQEVVAGRNIIIPKVAHVNAALLKAANRAAAQV
jgi:hypothetical protein